MVYFLGMGDNRSKALADLGHERRARISRLRLLGKSSYEIAEEIGISQVAASRHLRIIRDEWIEEATSSYQELVAKEAAKYDEMERMLPEEGDPLKIIDAWLKISARRAQLLGLDFSDKVSAARLEIEASQAQQLIEVFSDTISDLEPELQRSLMSRVVTRMAGPRGVLENPSGTQAPATISQIKEDTSESLGDTS